MCAVCEQALLEDHGLQKELREKREREKKDKELRKLADLEAARSEDSKRPGYQRLRANQVGSLNCGLVRRVSEMC